jgi:hypothetical protein
MTEPPIDQEQRDRVRANELRHSDKISELTRYIGFGLSILPWSLAFADQPSAKVLFEDWRKWVWFCASCGVLVLLLDYLQHKTGLLAAKAAAANPRNTYDRNSWAVKLNRQAEWLKEVISFFGCAVLFIVFLKAFDGI